MSNREFFVGYMPMPAGLRRFYRIFAPLLLLAGIAFAAGLSASQLGAGQGRWDPYAVANVQGYLSVAPYPVLHLEDGGSVLLVRAGKLSADEFADDYDGQFVAVKGAPIKRGGWQMLELSAAGDIQAWTPATAFQPPPALAGERVVLAGEIIDSKCFLGVMKPGAGKVHRACAAMCLTGGMPPMLAVTDQHGDRYGYMLVMPDGESASRHLVPDVAVPVTVSGRLEIRGDLTYLYIDEGGVSRVSS